MIKSVPFVGKGNWGRNEGEDHSDLGGRRVPHSFMEERGAGALKVNDFSVTCALLPGSQR